MDRPRAKKKVIKAPAVSASLGSTNLMREQVGKKLSCGIFGQSSHSQLNN